MKKILLALGMTTFLVGCVAHHEENIQLSDQSWNKEVLVVPPENIIVQPDENWQALQKLPEIQQSTAMAEEEVYMDRLAKKLRKELRSTGVQVKEVNGQIDLVIPNKVAFGNNQTKIQNSFQSPLSSVAKLLNEYNKTMIQIIGYTDNVGSVLANQYASAQKAEAIADFLKGENISPERIITDGAGIDNPIANNATPIGRELNRRIEITLICL